MEEAEALSTKIAIQIEGNLRCLESVQHIKNKFGKVTRQKSSYKMFHKQKLMQYKKNKEILSSLNLDELIKQIEPNGFGSNFLSIKKNLEFGY